MKLLCFVFSFCLFTACTKSHPDSLDVAGHWEWIKSTGGIANIHQTPQNSNYNCELVLNNDHTYSITGNLFMTGSGMFSLTDEVYESGTLKILNIMYPGYTDNFNYSFISNDTLRLDHHLEVDGFSYFFVRK